jgi:hypothetical protein
MFERRSPPFIDPLMGWTGGKDPLVQLELRFPLSKERSPIDVLADRFVPIHLECFIK